MDENGSQALQTPPRIERLKERTLKTPRALDTERLRLLTQGYQAHEDLPAILKRARALERVFERMTVFIEEEQLLAGNVAGQPMAAALYPEYSYDWIVSEIDEIPARSGDRFLVSPEAREEILSLADYWRGRTLYDRCMATLTEAARQCYQAGVLSATGNMTSGDGHTLVDFEGVLRHGLRSVIRRAEQKLATLDLTDAAQARSIPFLKAAMVLCQAVIGFANRYADLALALAEAEPSGTRREELQQIARACRHVPEHPARSFWEAVQSAWFIHLAIHIESNGHSWSLGRLDQYLNPYLERDLAEGALSERRAQELLCCLWLKMYSIPKLRPWVHTQFSAGNPTYQNVTIGGVRPDGRDGTNRATYLILDTVAMTRLPQPNLSARWHKGSPAEYLQRCSEVISLGFGMPALHSDEMMIPSLVMRGVSEEDARNYAIVGCIEPIVAGKWGYRAAGMSFTNFPKILEVTLNDGRDPATNLQVGPQTGSLEQLDSWEKLWAAWETQLRHFVRTRVEGDTLIDLAIEELVPDAFCSALIEDCIGRGKHLKEGGAIYDMVCGPETGLADTANSFAALQSLVYDQKAISPAALAEALRNDFEGEEGERLRRLLFNRGPKYGNDLESVDRIAAQVFLSYIKELERYHNARYGRGPIGCTYYPCTATISANVPMGQKVGALPSGRKARQPVAEGISPSQGTDRCGPTAVMKSVARLPNSLVTGGNLLNQRLSSSVLTSAEGKRRLIDLVKGFFALGGWHVQFNVISSEMLRAAQKDPERYADLVVRVAGYSARFVELAPDVQADIIQRTEHSL